MQLIEEKIVFNLKIIFLDILISSTQFCFLFLKQNINSKAVGV